MISPGSRYEDAERVFTYGHDYDENGLKRVTCPCHGRDIHHSRSTLFLTPTLPLPDRPEAEYHAKEDEHLPRLAFKFLEDSTQWWRIAEVNPQVWYPLDIQPGDQMRIPET